MESTTMQQSQPGIKHLNGYACESTERLKFE